MEPEILKQIEEDKKHARRRAERARYWKDKCPLLAKIFRLNAPPMAGGIWFDDETLEQPAKQPAVANVYVQPARGNRPNFTPYLAEIPARQVAEIIQQISAAFLETPADSPDHHAARNIRMDRDLSTGVISYTVTVDLDDYRLHEAIDTILSPFPKRRLQEAEARHTPRPSAYSAPLVH